MTASKLSVYEGCNCAGQVLINHAIERVLMSGVQECIEDYAAGVEYASHARKFLQLDRWTGDDPLLMLADAAGTTTGLSYLSKVKPRVEAFQEQFLNTERISSFGELATLNQHNSKLTEIFEAQRIRRVLITGADVFHSRDGKSDLDRLQQWAEDADPTTFSEDPFGQITGVGLRTFQYLRMIAGVDTVKPDIQVRRFIESLAEATDNPRLDASTDQAVLRSCRWLANETGYRMIELDQIAWWHFADTAERHIAETIHK
jgi:hypothetical protein